MELTKITNVEDIEKIDILHDSYHDAVIKIVYQMARDLQFLWWTYEQYRERTESYSDIIYDKWFDILWNLALRLNLKSYPTHMEDYADLHERQLAEKDLDDDFINLSIEEDEE